MINLTKNEAKVLGAFNTYDDLEGTLSDLGVSWTDAKDLSTETGIEMKSIKGVIASLSKKGLIYVDDDGPVSLHDLKKAPTAICLTEEGAKVFFELCAEESDAAEEEAAPAQPDSEPLETTYDHTDSFAVAFSAAGGHQPRGLCKALLAVALEWKGTRKEFLEGAVALGLKPNTAGAWWQVARKGR